MSDIIAFYNAHQVIIAAAVVAIIDFIYAINPNTQASGILHWIYSFFKKEPPAPPAA